MPGSTLARRGAEFEAAPHSERSPLCLNRNPWRTTQRYAIDADLLAELEREATALAIPLERYVEQVLLSVLPRCLLAP